jgi:hypothetical protein
MRFLFPYRKDLVFSSLDKAKKGLLLLKEAGMRKINFAGVKPFLYPKYLGRLLEYDSVVKFKLNTVVNKYNYQEDIN